MGRLTRDPDIRHTQGAEATAVARFTLAVNRRYGSEGQKADFISCVAFGRQGEFIEKYAHQETKLVIEGRIQTGSYTNRDGAKVHATDIIVENCEFAERKTAPQANQDDGFMDIPDTEDDMPFT